MRYIFSNPIQERGAFRVILLSLAAAVAFEVFAFVATQDLTVRAASPWREDPFNTPISGALFMVPALGAVLTARLLVWDAPGSGDRAQQMLRAAVAMVALVVICAGFQWAAVALGEGRSQWNGWTAALLGGLLLTSGLSAAAGLGLVRELRPRSRAWSEDWLGDVALLCSRAPVLRGLVGPTLVNFLRRRATEVFAVLSLATACAVTAALALGEGWTDPALIGWAIFVEATLLFTFCVLTNGLAGFIARPDRRPGWRTVEAAIVGGTVAVQLAVAFHEEIWELLAGGSDVPLAGLVAMTCAAALLGIGAGSALSHRTPMGGS